MRLEVGGVSGRFRVGNWRELRMLDAAELGECTVLKRLIDFLDSGDVFYDVGASVGVYSILLAQVVGDQGKVIAFEPEQQSYQHLLENVSLNGLTCVRCIRKALGAEPGEGNLYLVEGVSIPRLLAPSQSGRPGRVTSEKVEIVMGDRLVAEEHLPVPRVVKIDVEGYEFAVLQGLRQTLAQPACKLVCCEIHPHFLPAGVQAETVRELLKSLGFVRIERQERELDANYYYFAHKDDPTAH
jgi:FkbM family methyltransferase